MKLLAMNLMKSMTEAEELTNLSCPKCRSAIILDNGIYFCDSPSCWFWAADKDLKHEKA